MVVNVVWKNIGGFCRVWEGAEKAEALLGGVSEGLSWGIKGGKGEWIIPVKAGGYYHEAT